MKKHHFFFIILLIAVNTFLLIIDEPAEKKIDISRFINISPQQDIKKDDFETIDSILFAKKFNNRWISTKKTDSLWYKYIKVPGNYGIPRYNLFFQKIFRENDIAVKKVREYELSRKLIFEIEVNDSIPARIQLRIRNDFKEDVYLNGNLCIIFNGLGNEWGQEHLKNILEADVFINIAVKPGYWASGTIYEEALKNKKEIILELPMEPENGNIDKEKIKILKGMNEFTINILLEKAMKDMPGIKGLINHKGSKILNDIETLEALIKSIKVNDLFFIEDPVTDNSFTELLCGEYGVEYLTINIREDINKAVKMIHNGNDAILLMSPTSENYDKLTNIIEKYPDINFVKISQLMKGL